MDNIKITQPDNYVFVVVTEKTDEELLYFLGGLYWLCDDAEAQIFTEEEFREVRALNGKIGVELGLLSELQEEFEEGEQNRARNNNKISFDEWIEEKAELIMEE